MTAPSSFSEAGGVAFGGPTLALTAKRAMGRALGLGPLGQGGTAARGGAEKPLRGYANEGSKCHVMLGRP